VGAPQAWQAGYDGTGATVAVLDTGIDADHPDLAGQVVEAVSFVPGDEVTDANRHGTHVASTVAGTGAASDGAYRGVAPGADLIVGKVLGDDGFGQDSWVLAGMEWAAAGRGGPYHRRADRGGDRGGGDPAPVPAGAAGRPDPGADVRHRAVCGGPAG
jgi:subtilisin family serine protease